MAPANQEYGNYAREFPFAQLSGKVVVSRHLEHQVVAFIHKSFLEMMIQQPIDLHAEVPSSRITRIQHSDVLNGQIPGKTGIPCPRSIA